MSEERRTTSRAHVPGIHATYETASGELQRAEVMDLAVGGLFLRTDAPTAVGKRVALDIVVTGEPAPWSALGRVVWVRPVTVDEERPAGMAIKLIDIDEEVQAGIERLVAMRERTEPGVGTAPATPQAPGKERTILGVGDHHASDQVPTPAAFAPVAVPPATPVVPAPPAPGAATAAAHEPSVVLEEPSVVVEEPPPRAPEAPIAREPSIAIDLVSKKGVATEAAPPAIPRDARHDELTVQVARRPRRRGRNTGWLLLVAVLALAMAAYAFREQLLSVWNGVSS